MPTAWRSDFVVEAENLAHTCLQGRSSLADQLRRAAMSVCLNTAEGAGEYSAAEKARFYRLARRSATECAAALDICRALRLVDEPALDKGDDQLRRIVSMLTKLVVRSPGDL